MKKADATKFIVENGYATSTANETIRYVANDIIDGTYGLDQLRVVGFFRSDSNIAEHALIFKATI